MLHDIVVFLYASESFYRNVNSFYTVGIILRYKYDIFYPTKFYLDILFVLQSFAYVSLYPSLFMGVWKLYLLKNNFGHSNPPRQSVCNHNGLSQYEEGWLAPGLVECQR